jgi:predicted nucleic acid-binding protein
MRTGPVALDSDTIIEHCRNRFHVRERVREELAGGTRIYIPPFTYYEVKRGLVDASAAKQLEAFRILRLSCPVGAVSQAMFDAAVDVYLELKTKGKLHGDENDIYNAAFCRVYGLTLITHNIRHYENIDGLVLEDWVSAGKS